MEEGSGVTQNKVRGLAYKRHKGVFTRSKATVMMSGVPPPSREEPLCLLWTATPRYAMAAEGKSQ